MASLEEHLEAIRLHNCLVLIGLVILYWDHLLTFHHELQYFWHLPFSKAKTCFFLNRYLAFFANIPIWFITFINFGQERCPHFGIYHQALIIVTEIIVGVLLALRVYALYGCGGPIRWWLIFVAILTVGIATWSVVTASPEYDDLSCAHTLSEADGKRIAIAWICLFVYDLNIFCLTIWRSFRSCYVDGRIVKVPMVNVIALDGAKYFAVMLLANAANVVTFYAAPLRARGALSTFASAVSVTMMSRLMVNLHRNAGDIFASTMGGTGPFLDTTTSVDFSAGRGASTVPLSEGTITTMHEMHDMHDQNIERNIQTATNP